jgi:hypothetical protein
MVPSGEEVDEVIGPQPETAPKTSSNDARGEAY